MSQFTRRTNTSVTACQARKENYAMRVSGFAYTRFQCDVHSYLSKSIFRHHPSTASFDMLFEMSQSKPMYIVVGFMKTSPQGHQKVMLVGCVWRVSIRVVCKARRKMDVDRKPLCT